MIRKNIFKVAITFVFAFTISTVSAQIYNADFSTDGDGFPDHSTANPPAAAPASVGPFGSAGNQWSLNYTSKPSSDASDNIFKVSSGSLISNDWGGQGIFQSQSIDVSGINFVNISAATMNVGANDYKFEYFYILDNGSRIGTGDISSNNDDPINYNINNLDVSGASSLIVGFEFFENGANQGYSTSSFSVTNSSPISAVPTVTFDTAASSETETDVSFNVSIPVTVSNYGSDQIDISVSVTGGTAEVSDYALNTTSLSFTANGSQNISIDINPDADDFDDETIILTITETSSVTGLLISQNTHTITVTDDDTAPSIGFDTTTSLETETNATFTSANIPITVSNYSGTQININVSVSGGTAEAGDYTFTSPTALSFTANGTQNITVGINDDADTDAETIILTITETSSVTGLTISQATHTISIVDDETPILPNIIINEILADPGSIDSNGDGTISTYDDEFIELVNIGSTAIDLNGYTISDAIAIKYTFYSTSIPAGGSVVIFGGGTPTDIPGISISTTGLSLNNTGDTVFLKNPENTTIASYTYGSEANDDQSIGRNNDLSGDFIKHSEISSNPVLASPGRYNSTGQPFSLNTWTGAADNNWTNATNWSLGVVPTESDDVQIIKTTNQPTATNSINVNSLSMASGATLIATNTFSGVVTYKRTIPNSNQWYFMSSPVIGEIYDNDWAITNSILSGQNLNKGISLYDNSAFDTDTDAAGSDTETGYWRYLQSDNSNSSDFKVAQGYGIIRNNVGTVSFEGNGIYTTSQNKAISTGDSNFNLVGNPFMAYLNLGAFLDNNPVTSILAASEVYLWNGSSYDTKTAGLHSTYKISPGQGFFVEAASNTNLTFDIADVSHQNTETFQKNTRPEIHLLLAEGKNSRYANIYYVEGTTTGFDNGYDGKLFSGVSHSLAIYTHLVADNTGKKYQLQSLPNSDYENMVIPIGITADAEKEIIITAEILNLPSELKVFLEDKQTKSFTKLDETNTTYKVTLTEAINGVGRFFLHTTSKSTLNIDALSIESISIYKTTNSNLRVVGVSQGKASIKLFNILGKQVFNTSFKSKGIQDISLPKLATGIYIVQLETESGKLNKKITLE